MQKHLKIQELKIHNLLELHGFLKIKDALATLQQTLDLNVQLFMPALGFSLWLVILKMKLLAETGNHGLYLSICQL